MTFLLVDTIYLKHRLCLFLINTQRDNLFDIIKMHLYGLKRIVIPLSWYYEIADSNFRNTST